MKVREHPLFNKWRNIQQVCYNPNSAEYNEDNYCYWGPKGSREFYRYVERTLGLPPTPTAKLVRKNLDKGWQPGNLCYMEPSDHSNHMPNNCVFITYRRKTQSIMRWSKELGISHHILYQRHARGLTGRELFAQP